MSNFSYCAPAACANCHYHHEIEEKPAHIIGDKIERGFRVVIADPPTVKHTCSAKNHMEIEPYDICNLYIPQKGEEE